jgi:filamentous hemagglutinin family protein
MDKQNVKTQKSVTHFSLLSLLLAGSCLTAPSISFAQVESANGATQVYNSPNGVPVIDIANPNASGLSHNQYNHYNVGNNGLVLNNGTINQISHASQLAGQVAANLNLTSQARVILNEVVAPNRSQLSGFTEVVGGAADVIVANPYGITCSGCGFINAPQATLTTGAPILNGGAVTGFRVEKGDVLITGDGLNASEQNYLALIGRAIKVEGQINAKNLDIAAGANDWDSTTKTATARTPTGPAPAVAIDTSALGGMYANRIRLIATEAGAGVRMNGEAAAGVDDFTISSSGKVELNNKISAERDVGITSTQAGTAAIETSNASLSAKRDTNITAQNGEVKMQGGTVTANNNVNITSKSLTDSTTAGAGDNNKRYAAKNMNLTQTETTTLNGTIYGGGEALTVNSYEATIKTGSKLYAPKIDFNIGSNLTNESGAEILSAGNIVMRGQSSAEYLVDNAGTIKADALLDIKGHNDSNKVNITTQASTGKFIANTADLKANAVTLGNNSGITTDGNLTLNAETINTAGANAYIYGAKSNAGHTALTIAHTFANAGALYSGNTLTMNTAALTNASTGGIGARGTITISASNNVNNYGAIFTQDSLNISNGANSIHNHANSTIDAANDMSFTAGSFINNFKVIAGRNITIAAAIIKNEFEGGDQRVIGATKTFTENGACSPTDGSFTNCSSFQTNPITETIFGSDVSYEDLYRQAWTQTETYSGTAPTAATRPVLAAGTTTGSTLTLKNFNSVLNLGGIISGYKVDLQGNGGSTFTNDAYELRKHSYKIEWSSMCARPSLLHSCTWTIPTTADPRGSKTITANGASTNTTSALGASIMANTLTGNSFSLVNTTTPFSGAITNPSAPTGGTGTFTTPTNPNGLFVTSQNPNSKYLVESNPLFTNSNALGSDYLAKRFGIDPETMQRRLGDADYENYLVRQQLINHLGTSVISFGVSEAQQMQTLMDNGADKGKALGLTFGKAPTESQLASLDKDIVWMVETEVNGEKVLAPVVFLSQATKNAISSGAIIMASNIDLNVDSLSNVGGTIKSTGDMRIASTGDISNVSGTIKGRNVSLSSSEGSIINETAKFDGGNSSHARTEFGSTGVIESTGDLVVDAKKNIVNKGADMIAAGGAKLKAGLGIIFDTLEDKEVVTTQERDNGVFFNNVTDNTTTTVTHKRSGLTVGGNLETESGGDTTFAGTDVKVGGDAKINAGGNLNILSRDDSVNTITKESVTGLGVEGGVVGTKTTDTETSKTRNKGSSFQVGGTTVLTAAEKLTIQGSDIEGTGDITLKGKNVEIVEGRDTDYSKTTTTSTTLFKVDNSQGYELENEAEESASTTRDGEHVKTSASDRTTSTDNGGVTLSETIIDTTETNKSTSVGSKIKSLGSVIVKASENVLVRGSDIESGEKGFISGKNVDIRAAENTDEATSTRTVAKVGLYGTTVNEAGASADAEAYASASGKGDPKAGAEANAKADASTKNTVDLVRVDETTSTKKTTTHTGSSVKSGAGLDIVAQNELTVHGSALESEGDMNLSAKEMKFTAAIDRTEETTTGSHTRVGLYGDGTAEADANANASTQGLSAGGGVSANANAEVGVGLYGKNVTTGTTSSSTTSQVSSIKSGGDVTRTAEGTITDVGTDIEAGGSFIQKAKSWLNKAAQDTTSTATSNTVNDARLGLYADANAEAHGTASTLQGEDHGYGAMASAGLKGSLDNSTDSNAHNTSTSVVSSIKSGRGMDITTTEKTTLEGTKIESKGDINLDTGSLDYKAAKDTETKSTDNYSTNVGGKIGIDATKSVTGSLDVGHEESSSSYESSKAVVGEMKSGGNINIKTKDDLRLEGTNIDAAKKTELDAGGNVDIVAARDTESSSEEGWGVDVGISASKKGNSTGKGLSLGANIAQSESESSTAVTSTIKGGDGISIKSGKTATLEGADLESDGSIKIAAADKVNITAAESTESSSGWSADASTSGNKGGARGQNGRTRAVSNEAEGGVSGAYSESDSTTSKVANIKAGNNVEITSGGDTTLVGTNIEAGETAKIEAGGTVDFKAAKNTKKSFDISGGASGVVTRESGDEDGNGVKDETTSKGKGGAQIGGEDTTTNTVGSLKSKVIQIFSGKDTNLEGTSLESEGKTNIEAGGDVNLRTADGSTLKGGVGVLTGSVSVAPSNASIDTSSTSQNVKIKSGDDVTIKSGGKTVMQGTDIETGGKANIEAKGGVDKQDASRSSFGVGFDHGDASSDTIETKIKENVKSKVPEPTPEDELLMKIYNHVEKTKDIPVSTAQTDIKKQLEAIDADKSLSPLQKQHKREVLEERLKNQKALELIAQDINLQLEEKMNMMKLLQESLKTVQ